MNQARKSKDPVNLSAIGATLKEERIGFGMTQEQAAKQFEISLKSLRNLEQGVGGVPLSTASAILAYFGKELRVGDIVFSPQNKSKTRPRRDAVVETLRLVRPVLEKKFNVKKIALFGSVARDAATKRSDIDLAVTFDKIPDFVVLGKMVAFLETLFDGNRVDLVEASKMIDAIKKNAKKDFIYVD